MKVIGRIIFLVLMGSLVAAFVMLLPDIKGYRDCYKRVEDKVYQKGTISRKAYRSEEDMCRENKDYLVETGMCFSLVEQSSKYAQYLFLSKIAGKRMAFSNNELAPLVEKHNNECDFRRTKIYPDKDF